MKNYFTRTAVLIFILILSACQSTKPALQPSGLNPTTLAFSNDAISESVMGKWARSCALCHVTGEAGAPIVGDTAEWQRRLAQGEDSIMKRVIEGYNSMPPLGYCMACEASDFRVMIGYMAGTNR